MDLNGKRTVIIGMGKTGIATARFLGAQGARVVVTDEKPRHQWESPYEQIANEKWLETGTYNAGILRGADLVIPSPGVPPDNEILLAAVQEKIPVISEIELAYRFLKSPIIAVTGTNGKTTTTTLLGKILTQAGKKVFVGGNIGNPLIEYAGNPQTADFIVAEISSFQLQWMEDFHPFIAVLLNVTYDHINYHGSFAEYLRIKSRIFSNQVKADFAILNADDPLQKSMAQSIRAQVICFSSATELPHGIYLKDNTIYFKPFDRPEESFPLSMIKITGRHNVENVMAAIMVARISGCDRDSIIAAITDFSGLPHRIEFTAEKKGVRFYDDSKGTNVGSVVRALDTFSAPVILLLGGRDKDGDFATLQPLLAKKVKKVILFGEARDRIGSLLGEVIPSEKQATLHKAIASAFKNATTGDVVLLSPGCASFDEFKNYKERGNFFKDIVRKL